jgi:hypothetical protein
MLLSNRRSYMKLSEVQALEHLASQIASKELEGGEALAALQKYSDVEVAAADIVHLLHHMVSDADLRAADPAYKWEQGRRLEVLLASLRNNAT